MLEVHGSGRAGERRAVAVGRENGIVFGRVQNEGSVYFNSEHCGEKGEKLEERRLGGPAIQGCPPRLVWLGLGVCVGLNLAGFELGLGFRQRYPDRDQAGAGSSSASTAMQHRDDMINGWEVQVEGEEVEVQKKWRRDGRTGEERRGDEKRCRKGELDMRGDGIAENSPIGG